MIAKRTPLGPLEVSSRGPNPDGRQLEAVRGRRRQLIRLLMFVAVLAAAGVVVFSSASDLFGGQVAGILDIGILRLSFVALAAAFALYVWEKERTLSRLEHELIEQRVVSSSLSHRLQELSAISRAGRAVASVLSLDDVLGLILGSARDLLGATEGSVMLLDEEKMFLRIAASVGLDGEISQVVPVSEGVSGWVAEFREPVIIRGDDIPPRFRRFLPQGRQILSAMSAPLYARAEPVGVLNVSVSSGGRTYADHDLQAFTALAEHAAVAIANARTFERARETARRLEEADARRREFLAIVTHDLRSPLTAVLGYTRLLRDHADSATLEQRREFVAAIEGQGSRMLEMLDQLVRTSTAEDGAPVVLREPLDLRTVVTESVDAFRGVLGPRPLELWMPGSVPEVSGDRSALEHILANLLDNAVKYSPDGSPLEVRIEVAAQEVRVTVADKGPGIPEALLTQVFDRYHRADGAVGEGGFGLGLFIVRSLAEAQGGRAWADNQPEGGARVTVALPRVADG